MVLIIEDDEAILGCNIENTSYGIVVIDYTKEPISTYVACRKIIIELCAKDMPVILINMQEKIQETTVGELLPWCFSQSDLD